MAEELKEYHRHTSRENSPNREAANAHRMGKKKYKEMIDKSSKQLDKYGNLPFTFSKPPKKTQKRRDVYYQCTNCTEITSVNKNTRGIVCPKCHKFQSIPKDYQLEIVEQ